MTYTDKPMHAYVLSIGSNDPQKAEIVELAGNRLSERFPEYIEFATPLLTEPCGGMGGNAFCNQLVRLETACTPDELRAFCKSLERNAGRCDEDKAKGKVVLDVDILSCDGQVLKPDDWGRDYVSQSLAQLQYRQEHFIGIIPARYASTRFPAKPLAMLGGKPVIQRVYEQVSRCLKHVYVATDDERIASAVRDFGGKVVLTASTHRSGTDRCYEAYTKIRDGKVQADDIVINIQGDEPFIQPSQIMTVEYCFDKPGTQIATLVKPFTEADGVEALFNVNSPKVVVSKDMNAMYFSRSVIPFRRGVDEQQWLKGHTYYKHIGLYAYRAMVLQEITRLQPSALETAESLEQLRWLENGYTIKVGISHIETIGIDTPHDLERAEQFLKDHA